MSKLHLFVIYIYSCYGSFSLPGIFGCVEILVVESCLMGLANKYVSSITCESNQCNEPTKNNHFPFQYLLNIQGNLLQIYKGWAHCNTIVMLNFHQNLIFCAHQNGTLTSYIYVEFPNIMVKALLMFLYASHQLCGIDPRKMLNWPKKLFLPVCPLPQLGDTWARFAPITFHSIPCYGCSKRHITCPVTCYIPLIPITGPKHA
jgi:hypothetical protein